MINAVDLKQMRADALLLRDDNPQRLVIRRGSQTLDVQIARPVPPRRGSVLLALDSKETRAAMIFLGDQGFDVKLNDRFTLAGVLYRVTFIEPDQRAGTHFECIVEE